MFIMEPLQSLSLPLILTFLLFFLLTLVVRKENRSKTQKPNSKLPPGPWKLPLIGSLHHLRGNPLHTLKNLAKKHGPIMHLQLGEISSIVISSAEMAREVLKTHDRLFLERPQFQTAKIVCYDFKDVAFAPYGAYWRELRKICTLQLLSAKRVKSFQSLREEEASKLIGNISLMEGSPMNLSENVYSLINDVISIAAFGKKCKDKNLFITAVQAIINSSGGGFGCVDLFPSLKALNVIVGTATKIERLHHTLDMILDGIIKEHIENRKKSTIGRSNGEFEEDLVDVLLGLQEGVELECPITIDNIKAVIFDVFAAGTETSSTTVEWAMSEMVRNPRVLKKAQTELRKALQGKTKIDEADIQEMHYLKSVIKETLRLHPPLPLLIPRQCRETCEINGYVIPRKTQVIVNAWAIGRDPEFWTDAESFKPERFDNVFVDFNGNNFGFIPFGAGRRGCPGILLGIANVELLLAQLLYHFDWKLPNGIRPEELDMTESFGSTVRRQKDLYLIPIPYCS